ncbi:arsenate reductase [Alicyclobacillus contaminans]|uniref:arsenate reductase family protein n=1 Tax=Alicyclobacillus contaminans TaxID=392016 RepID=UPI000402BEFE|nr:Spx/MgsR family RNA polymerase-binding regulatory protein [Alicyclobacillus contaminans]GMA49453.1 arsenate reductase [Alicyclobacillus contaminans]
MEFYGYRKCSTCRNAHKYLADHGVDVAFQDFVVQPPSREQLQSWVDKLGQGIGPFVNTKGTRYRELGLKDKQLSDAEWMELLTMDGKLLKRPVLVLDDRVIVGFDKEQYDKLFQKG